MVNPVKIIAQAGRKIIKPAVKVAQKIKTNKPEVYVFVGVGMILTSFVAVAIQSTKAPEVMAQTAGKMQDLREKKEALEAEDNPTEIIVDATGNQEIKILNPTEKDIRLKEMDKEIQHARWEGVWLVGKLYIPWVVLLLLGFGFDLHGVQILRKENVALAATVSGLEKFINFYRGNVIEDQGKEKDHQYAHGIIGEKTIKEIKTDENGNDIVEKKKLPVVKKDNGNPWRFEYSPTFFRSATGDPDRDISHIKIVEDYWNRIYGGRKKHGFISYYEVIEYLDPIWDAIDPTGEIENFCRENGWGHSAKGDDFIDLGVYRAINDAAIKGIGDVVYIEGNCDGTLRKIKNQYKERYLT